MYNLPNKTLFTWQQECLRLWFENGSRGIVNVVTGAGKTLLALGAVHSIKEKLKVKIVVPKVFLVSQWTNAIRDELGIPREEIGVYSGKHKDAAPKDYMIYVINSARYSISRHILDDLECGYPVLLICDECHNYGSGENSKIFDFLPYVHRYEAKYYSLGLSATPQSPNYHKVLVPALGEEIYRLSFSEAIKENIISKYSIFNIGLHFHTDEAGEYADLSDKITKNMHTLKKHIPQLGSLNRAGFYAALQDLCDGPHAQLAKLTMALLYKRKKIVYSARARIDCACTLIERLDKKSKIIIFGEQIEMIEALYKRLNTLLPGQTGRYHSKMSVAARTITLNNYQNMEIRILICCRALDEGLNVPQTDVGIILSSTGSVRQRIQRIGRILRRCAEDGAKSVYYLHVADSSEEDGLVTEDIYADMPVYHLSYDYKTDDFAFSEYDRCALQIMDDLSRKGTSPDLMIELSKNFKLGQLRGGWQISAEKCLANIRAATDKAERNYWIAMLKIIQKVHY
ncbi:MAG: DEAD/DEAH box helicase [Clostridiales bacterium]|nr:DEAD/DEAH box helicase [Clostridiales bacterium]